MPHFVVYHNPEVMGYRAENINGLAIVTDKPANGISHGNFAFGLQLINDPAVIRGLEELAAKA